MSTQSVTHFASAKRATPADLFRQAQFFTSTPPLLHGIFNAVPDLVAVLNQERQIVYANNAWAAFVQPASQLANGPRPGEALDCRNASLTSGGCGTSEFCRTCGAVLAILSCQHGSPELHECRIIRQDGEALDLRVWASPISLEGENFTIFVASDISHEKRRRALERVFFHDVLNTATGLLGWAGMLNRATLDELEEFQSTIYHLTERLIDEIKSQKLLAAAENDELIPQTALVHTLELLQEIAVAYRRHEVARGRLIAIDPQAENLTLRSDPTLLRRVLQNMLKNALEACQPGEMVTLGCHLEPDGICIWVQNPNHMPAEVQLQVFQRSFSTKGADRGLGTYSMKILGERYLKGKVSFAVDGQNTIFQIKIPAELT